MYNKNGNESVTNVLDSIKQQHYSSKYSRYYSWEECYNAFRSVYKKRFAPNDTEFLALHLIGYLASWGMYRGSSDLLRRKTYITKK